jgi:DNA-binding CsgD family transcriptional regulator
MRTSQFPLALSGPAAASLNHVRTEPAASPGGRVIELPVRRARTRQLTARELRVLAEIARGDRPAEIARRLTAAEGSFISGHTVESYARCAVSKLGARSEAHAVAIALHRNLIRAGESS